MPGRRYSEGLHQAIEAKEGRVRPARERHAGADHLPELLPPLREARRHDGHGVDRGDEFRRIYNLDVVPIPTHRPMIRATRPDLVFKTEDAKFNAVVDEIAELNSGRPVLVGTVSIEKSERWRALLIARRQARGAERQAARA